MADATFTASLRNPYPLFTPQRFTWIWQRNCAPETGVEHVGYRMPVRNRGFLPHRNSVRRELQSSSRKGSPLMGEILLLAAIVTALLGYLVYALLRPEKF
jgi:K+-transporting ATPase KdpF subunit